jgi:Na+/proline symporter
MSGGLLADAYADFIQGIAIICGLFFLLFSIVTEMGGVSAALSTIPLEKLTLRGGDFEGLGFLGKIELWMVPILGSLITQELVSRVVASKTGKIARNSAFRAAGLYFMVGSIPVFIGLLGVKYMPGLADAETLMPVLAKVHLNYFFYIVFVGALVSAILSTVDTTLLACSALISHNLVYPSFPKLSDRKRVVVARLGTLVSGVVAYLIAFSSQSIVGLVEMASSLGGPSILIITIIALWEKRGNAINANFAIIMSVVTWACSHYLFELEFPIIMTVVVCGLSYFVSLPFTKAETLIEEAGMSEVELS